MTQTVAVACIQLTAGTDLARNIEKAVSMGRQAAAAGAAFIAFPENVTMIESDPALALAKSRPEAEHPGLAAFVALARETRTWILAGSLSIRAGADRYFNRCHLIASSGDIAARYDKLHMFDVDLEGGESYRESNRVAPGSEAVLADTPFGRVGLTICYDVRFPQLYRTLAKAGADLITVPAAFTQQTGEAHWHVLLRARAIECGAFVLAPAQWGVHAAGRRTFGHSLIVDPWGRVLADGGEGERVVAAVLDLAEVGRARRRIPALEHDRAFTAPGPTAPRRAAE
jgi:predicted amidohydrolase